MTYTRNTRTVSLDTNHLTITSIVLNEDRRTLPGGRECVDANYIVELTNAAGDTVRLLLPAEDDTGIGSVFEAEPNDPIGLNFVCEGHYM